jgi:hypothetical protein
VEPSAAESIIALQIGQGDGIVIPEDCGWWLPRWEVIMRFSLGVRPPAVEIGTSVGARFPDSAAGLGRLFFALLNRSDEFVSQVGLLAVVGLHGPGDQLGF